MPSVFFDSNLFQKIIGEDYYYENIIDFFHQSHFVEKKNQLSVFPYEMASLYFQNEIIESFEEKEDSKEVFDFELLNQFYFKHI